MTVTRDNVRMIAHELELGPLGAALIDRYVELAQSVAQHRIALCNGQTADMMRNPDDIARIATMLAEDLNSAREIKEILLFHSHNEDVTDLLTGIEHDPVRWFFDA